MVFFDLKKKGSFLIQLQPLRPTGDLWGPLGPFGLVWAGQGPSGAVGTSLGPSGAAGGCVGPPREKRFLFDLKKRFFFDPKTATEKVLF